MTILNYLKNRFYRCQGKCKICFNEGGCLLEKKIKKHGIEEVKREIYP